ncbi:hypothetical protein BZG35_05705 [Brevundimonas sp. LM2]|nr:hypothetical protein BZG35_05705 [Brevundimonas sp. LM2]
MALGCSRIGSFSNPTPMADIRATLRRALELGVNVFDTADVYGQGDSEREIGKLLKGRRDQGFVVTKLGLTFSTKMKLLRLLKPILKPIIMARGGGEAVAGQRGDNMSRNFDPATFAPRLDASLGRLGFTYVDALLLHSPPASVAGDPAVGAALAALKAAGKVRHFGVSCDDHACLEAALTMPGLTLLQLPLDVIDAIQTSPVGEEIARRSIGVLAREVIRFQPGIAPPTAVANALGRNHVTSVIVGTSKTAHLEQAAAAVLQA